MSKPRFLAQNFALDGFRLVTDDFVAWLTSTIFHTRSTNGLFGLFGDTGLIRLAKNLGTNTVANSCFGLWFIALPRFLSAHKCAKINYGSLI